MSTNMDRRLTSIEEAMAAESRSCRICEEWTRLLIRFRDLDGTIRNSNGGGWPAVEVPTCPGCGRTCEKVITITTDPRGPA
jgi:hypothetical protein